jgi:hypothetical protein
MRLAYLTIGALTYLASICVPNVVKAELICVHPVPLTIKELAEKRKADVISDEIMELNSEYLTLKYCAITGESLTAVSSVTLGDGCEMKWGYRLGELVYWSACKTADLPETRPDKLTRPTAPGERKSSIAQEIKCCVQHWIRRQGGRVAPEGQSTHDFKSRSDLLLTCREGVPRRSWSGYAPSGFCALR